MGDSLGDGGRLGDWGMGGEVGGRGAPWFGRGGNSLASRSTVVGGVGRVGSSRGRLRGEGGADDCSENCGERWRSANRGEGSRDGDRMEEAQELAVVEGAVEVGWESHEGVVRTMLASSSSGVRKSAATMRKEVSRSL